MDLQQPPRTRSPVVPLAIAAGLGVLLLGGHALFRRAAARTNRVALASSPRPVTVVTARSAQYRPTRRYVGTLEPWVEAHVGPQLVAAYVSTVLVRPGTAV